MDHKAASTVFETTHGTVGFPFHITTNDSHRTARYSKDFVYYHYHRQMEFVYVQEGCVELEVDNRTIVASRGDSVCVNPGELHCGKPATSERCVLECIVFDPEMLSFRIYDVCEEQYLSRFMDGTYLFPHYMKNNENQHLQSIIHHLRTIINVDRRKRPGYQLEIKSHLYAIFAHVVEGNLYIHADHASDPAHRRDVQRLKRAIRYIEDHYSAEIQVKNIADVLALSADHTYKFFRSMTGRSPIQYLNHVRTRKAVELLNTTDRTVLDVALATGFGSATYFIRTFRTHYGVTPAQHRQHNLTAENELSPALVNSQREL